MKHEIKCIDCGKECPEPFVFQSSDIFSQTWLRVCDLECFYGLIFDYLYSINKHKSFYRWVGDKENAIDKEARKKRTDEITEEFQRSLKERKFYKDVLSQPSPTLIPDVPSIPIESETPVKFKRYNISLESKIKGSTERIVELEGMLKETKKELKEYLKKKAKKGKKK